MTAGLHDIDSLTTAVEECNRRSLVHSKHATWFGALLTATVVVALGFLAYLIFTKPLDKVTSKETTKETTKETIKEPMTPALTLVLPTLAILVGFLASLSRFQLRTMSRWDDYGIAFARLRIAETKSTLIAEQAALLAAAFAAVGTPPDVELSALIKALENLSANATKSSNTKRTGDGEKAT